MQGRYEVACAVCLCEPRARSCAQCTTTWQGACAAGVPACNSEVCGMTFAGRCQRVSRWCCSDLFMSLPACRPCRVCLFACRCCTAGSSGWWSMLSRCPLQPCKSLAPQGTVAVAVAVVFVCEHVVMQRLQPGVVLHHSVSCMHVAAAGGCFCRS